MQVLFGAKKSFNPNHFRILPRPSSMGLNDSLNFYYFKLDEWKKIVALTIQHFSPRLKVDLGQKTYYNSYHRDDLILAKLYNDAELYKKYKDFFDAAFDTSKREEALAAKDLLKSELLVQYNYELNDLQKTLRNSINIDFNLISKKLEKYNLKKLKGWEMPLCVSKKVYTFYPKGLPKIKANRQLIPSSTIISEEGILKLILNNSLFVPFENL